MLKSRTDNHPAIYTPIYQEQSAQQRQEEQAIVVATLRNMEDYTRASKLEKCQLDSLCSNKRICRICQHSEGFKIRKKLDKLETEIMQRFPRHVKRFSTITVLDSAPNQIVSTSNKLQKAMGLIYPANSTSNPFYAGYWRIEFKPSKANSTLFNIHAHILTYEPLKRSLDEDDLAPLIDEKLITAGLTPRSVDFQYGRSGRDFNDRRYDERIPYIAKPAPLKKLADAGLLIPFITETKGLRLVNTIKSAEFKKTTAQYAAKVLATAA